MYLNSFAPCGLLHTYVSAHDGTFDGPEKTSLRMFFDARRVTPGEGLDLVRTSREDLETRWVVASVV